MADISHLEATVRRKLAAQALDYACWTYDRERTDPALEDKLVEFAISTSEAATTTTNGTACKGIESADEEAGGHPVR